ncbi:MAG: adenylate/guanylate cyclase domain-containing protein [Chloroflexota bacterium]|nr:adenylate/guanylate cyclase domain-containing protein [Chloroflexota bacterium]
MEPRIQYCKTPDGVNLAYSCEGSGSPIVYLPSPSAWGNMQVQLQVPRTKAETGYLAQQNTVVHYDCRGAGLSDRDVDDLSLDAHVRDCLAVLDRVASRPVTLLASVFAGPIAISVAHQYPERVSHLILTRTAANLPAVFAHPRLRALDALIGIDWDLYTEVVARSIVGWDHEAASRIAAQLRAEMTSSDVERWYDQVRTWNVTTLLSGIRTPTLVIHNKESPVFGDERWPREVAAAIPGAHLVKVSAGEETARAVDEFVNGRSPARNTNAGAGGTAIILFVDIVDSTPLTEQLGDKAFRVRASQLDAAVRANMRQRSGMPIDGKVMGDGVMGVFAAAHEAIDAARACRTSAEGMGLSLHIGVHAGDVIREDNNVYGGAVNIASRICGLCEPGEILVSGTVRELARTSAGVTFEDRGEQMLKGIDDPLRVYAVRPTSNI